MNGQEHGFFIRAAGRTDVGRVRQFNEDSFAVETDLGLWAVADGMGGHSAGDVASRIIVEELASLGVPVNAEDQRSRIRQRLERAHQRIQHYAQDNDLMTVGATVAALMIFEAELTCVWAGDSRIYLWRQGKVTALTRDHSEVAELIAAGAMTEAEARNAPQRNIITRAIGIGMEARPDMVSGMVEPGDRFLICSDGLTEHLDIHDLSALLANPAPPDAIAQALISETLERGAKDNVSVVIVDCDVLIALDEVPG